MSQQELVIYVVRCLEELGIAYMLTGSLASSLQGEPRSTHDVDLVIELHQADVQRFTEVLGAGRDVYLDREEVVRGIREGSVFNLIDLSSGVKVDFWMLTDEAFDVSRFSRRIKEEILGMPVFLSTPEDTILAKLRWARLSGGSEKQMTDARRVYEVQNDILDMPYLSSWIERLDLKDQWRQIAT